MERRGGGFRGLEKTGMDVLCKCEELPKNASRKHVNLNLIKSGAGHVITCDTTTQKLRIFRQFLGGVLDFRLTLGVNNHIP